MDKDSSPFKYKIRQLTPDDANEYNDLLCYAFQITEQELQKSGWHNDEIMQSKFPVLERADVLGCFDGKKLISQFASYPLDMNIYGKIYPVGFVTSVCTYPEYSGQGIMKKLMTLTLEKLKKEGKYFALLYPYSIPLYRNLGWEIISNKISYIVKDFQLPKTYNAKGHIVRVDWTNEDFKKLHNKFAKMTHGCLFRNLLAWEEYWRWDEDDTNVAVYYDEKDEPTGYIVYLIESDTMYIKEMIYLNRDAHNGLWKYINAHQSMIDEVKGNTYYSEPIAFEMSDSDIKETISPYAMGRIIDVKNFFKNYTCSKKANGEVFKFVISDKLLDWNNLEINIKFDKGKCEETKEETQNIVKMDIGTLTTLLIGYKTATSLFEMEKIESNAETIELLDDVLQHKLPYISDYI